MVGFSPGVAETIGYYVYLLIDPRIEEVFYVGKGTGNRCFAHVAEARQTQADAVGDYSKLERIREIESAGYAVQIDVLRHSLSEREAFLVESVTIDLLGIQTLDNRVPGHNSSELGHMSVSDINAQYGVKAINIDPAHQVVLIRINRLFERRMTDAELYEATRKWWVIGPLRRDPGTKYAPRWAMAVYGGIVRAVYQIQGWKRPSDEDIAPNPKRATRWAFRGTRDSQMEDLYLHGDVSEYLRSPRTGQPTQNPIRYVNCS